MFYRDFKHAMKATCRHCRTPTTFHQQLLVHMIVGCLIPIAMLEASHLAKLTVGRLSFARALIETRLLSPENLTGAINSINLINSSTKQPIDYIR